LWIRYKKRTANVNTTNSNSRGDNSNSNSSLRHVSSPSPSSSSPSYNEKEVIKQWDESPTSSCGIDAFVTLLNPSSYNPQLFECLAEAVTPSRELVIRWMAPYLRRFSKYIPSQNMWLCDQKRMGPEYMNRDVGEMYLRQGICECVDVLRQFNGREEVINVALNVLEGF